MKLTNVARASLEELRLDYRDFLRQRGQAEWEKSDTRRADLIARRPATADDVAQWCTAQKNGRSGQSDVSITSTMSTSSTSYCFLAANAALVLIAVACSLLDRQIAAQSAAFVKVGGFSERLYRTRTQSRRG